VTIARIFSVTSAKMRDGFLYPELLRRAREKDFKPLPGHQNVRDFIDAEVAAEELLRLAAMASPPSVVHIAGETKSVRELAEGVMSEHGISPEQMSSMFPPPTEPVNYLISEKKEKA
jgi:UDP-glucose 4-epimerase/GDP-4-dehydro-6-deoxy-D-mannose reductase